MPFYVSQEAGIFKAILIAALVIGIILIFFIYTIIRQHRRTHALYIANIASGIDSLENERKDIAADIHDELGPLLSATKMKMECIDNVSEENNRYKEKAIAYIDTIIEKMRDIANGLIPSVLINEGLIKAINAFILIIKAEVKIAINLEANFEKPADKNIEIHIYRIIQEIVHNSIKHSGASIINISIFKNPDGTIIIKTIDNGNGFNKKENLKKGGTGINNIKRRVDILGGRLHLNTSIYRGTAYYIEIPFV